MINDFGLTIINQKPPNYSESMVRNFPTEFDQVTGVHWFDQVNREKRL